MGRDFHNLVGLTEAFGETLDRFLLRGQEVQGWTARRLKRGTGLRLIAGRLQQLHDLLRGIGARGGLLVVRRRAAATLAARDSADFLRGSGRLAVRGPGLSG